LAVGRPRAPLNHSSPFTNTADQSPTPARGFPINRACTCLPRLRLGLGLAPRAVGVSCSQAAGHLVDGCHRAELLDHLLPGWGKARLCKRVLEFWA